MSEESSTDTSVAPDGAIRKGDWVLLVVALLIGIPLVLFGYGVGVMALLGCVAIISFMTMQAVMEERGRDEAGVKRVRMLLPLLGICLLPPLVLGLVVDSIPLWIALLPSFAVLGVAVWNARRVGANVTLRKLLRGAGEKEAGFLDMQLLRNAVLVTIICVIAVLGDSRARTLWGSSRMSDAQSIAAEAERSLDEARESMATLSAATEELKANMVRVTAEAYAEWNAEEREEFLDRIERDESGDGMWDALLERLLEIEEDEERRKRMRGMLKL